ncbi:MAG: nitronate monooxygenase [Phycisphaerales bacterium]|nr:nitronate monooxygenase [Phycisphaerales bacterium]
MVPAGPTIIQGGMGVGISNWVLAKAVSSRGQLGVVSGSVLDTVFIRRLQDGDSGGHLRRALRRFPVPSIAEAALTKYLKPEGRQPGQPYARLPLFGAKLTQDREDLLVLAHFAEVYLAKEGHGGIVGLNLLEKVQMVTLPSLYGAILAGVSHVLMGAGIPASIPGALDKLSNHLPASLPLDVADRGDHAYSVEFDPTRFALSSRISLQRPRFFPIVSSATLAKALLKRANGKIDGFVVEGHASGGHNAPPRGDMRLTVRGEPVYGERDIADLEQMRAIGVPFWLAGAYGTPEKVQQALAAGAHGVQVGTLFALCDESGLRQDLKREMLERIANGNLDVFNDPLASPTGFPFRVAAIPQTLSCDGTYGSRLRVCDMGYLRVPYRKSDGTLGYRCPAEPVEDYEKKGGLASETIGRKCLCNALPANIGLEQVQTNGYEEHPLVTIGADVASIQPLLSRGNCSYTAGDVLDHLLGDSRRISVSPSPVPRAQSNESCGVTQQQTTTRPNGLADLPFGSRYEAFGCRINTIRVEELFARYEQCGFIYPAKRERLKPHWSLIMDNWRRSMLSRPEGSLHHVIIYDHPETGSWASVSYWNTTCRVVHSQHVVSIGRPEGSRAVLLSEQSELFAQGRMGAQSWYRAENRFPARVFGSCVATIGATNAMLHEHTYITIPRDQLHSQDATLIDIHCCNNTDAASVNRLAHRLCGRVQATADEWNAGDVELAHLNDQYKEIGLRRYRRVFLASMRGMSDPVGLAVAYRGPLGLSFSFLENRCELWLDATLDGARHLQIACALARAVRTAYTDFELPHLFFAVDRRTGEALRGLGAQHVQDYQRLVWLHGGMIAAYSHINSFYARIMSARNRHTNSSITRGVP